MPLRIIKSQQERQKSITFKFEALQVFVKLWKALAQRIRTIVLNDQKAAVCHFFGTFCPISLLGLDEKAILKGPSVG